MMKTDEFEIGTEFTTTEDGKKWRCTDVGTRTIVAICLEHDDDPSWYAGPPYAVAEFAFDDLDLENCVKIEN